MGKQSSITLISLLMKVSRVVSKANRSLLPASYFLLFDNPL